MKRVLILDGRDISLPDAVINDVEIIT